MCLGAQARAQNESARRQYEYAKEKREREWMQNLSIYSAQKNQYEIDMDNASLAQAAAYTQEQEQANIARDEAKLKFQDQYLDLIENSKYGKMMASGQIGKSVERRRVLELSKYGKKTTDVTRKILLNDRKLAMVRAEQVSKLQGFKDKQFAQVAFQPVEGVPPPQPVMRNVGAAAFMDALSIGSKVAGIATAFQS